MSAKNFIPACRIVGAVLGAVCVAFSAQGAAPAPPPAAPAAPVEIPKSVFVDDYKVGRDPFYPNSKRRLPVKKQEVVVVVANNPAKTNEVKVVEQVKPPEPPPEPASYLLLKAILGSKARAQALIDTTYKTYDFVRGDTLTVKIPDHPDKDKQRTIKIRCVEIKESSVVVEIIDGGKTVTKELNLGKKL